MPCKLIGTGTNWFAAVIMCMPRIVLVPTDFTTWQCILFLFCYFECGD